MNIDPKLTTTVLTALISYAVLKLGIGLDDATVASLASLAAGALAGYLKANDGTVLRTPQEDGNAEIPEEPQGIIRR